MTHIIVDSFGTWCRDMTRYDVTAPPPHTQFNTPPVRAKFAVGTVGTVLCNSESCMASSISLLFPLSPKMPVLATSLSLPRMYNTGANLPLFWSCKVLKAFSLRGLRLLGP